MWVSGFSKADSSFQTFLWVAVVVIAFLGLASMAEVLSSAFPGSSSWVLFVLAANARFVGIFRGEGSLVPYDVVWAKQALVLCPSLPYLRQSALFCLYLLAYSSGMSFMAALKDSHRISCVGDLSFLLGPVPPVVTAGPRSFFLARVALCSGFHF